MSVFADLFTRQPCISSKYGAAEHYGKFPLNTTVSNAEFEIYFPLTLQLINLS